MGNERKPIWQRKRPQGFWILLCVAAIGILLLTLGEWGGDSGGDETSQVAESSDSAQLLDAYAATLEKKIASLCGAVNGVSGVEVAVTLVGGFESVYAADSEVRQDGDSREESYRYLTVGSGSSESVVLLCEKLPAIAGIGIVCRGGSSPEIQKELILLVSAAFGVPSNKIYVTGAG